MRLVYTAGVWDLLHRGHLNFLWASKQLGDVLVVGVVSDPGCMEYKGIIPHDHAQLRFRNISKLGFVDMVVHQQSTDPRPQLERWTPDLFTHADGEADWTLLRRRVESLGIEYVNIPYTEGISSTRLRARTVGRRLSEPMEDNDEGFRGRNNEDSAAPTATERGGRHPGRPSSICARPRA